ncbi:type I-E CRISPR-associated protein Cse2/CasB [Gilliamella sp. wkB112]|uniref:type I-E CRISPR-associated protein Cse2/CasB n=1 Tax=Gilliamella sp. wkB112 TaxID=3120257 RepID=UPI00080DE872|nr:type I-E CRISPR-associated protein Cse2/CasB [Gilliamella apicola]OCG04681.1 type I-E CRISPR-associated protein Cse2/CasB [Gilliamella apicola]
MLDNFIKKQIILNESHKKCINEWFALLQQRSYTFNGKSYNGLKLRAELRRASSLDEVRSQEGYWILADIFFAEGSGLAENTVHHQALTLFVAVVIYAKANNSNAPFASQLSEKVRGGERNFLSKLRFEQLVNSETDEEFCRRLIRAVKLRGANGVNLFSLADSVFLWVQERHDRLHDLPANSDPFKRNSVRWAKDYYSTKKTSKE